MIGSKLYPVVFKIRTIDQDLRSQIYEIFVKKETGYSRGGGYAEAQADAQPSYGVTPISEDRLSRQGEEVNKEMPGQKPNGTGIAGRSGSNGNSQNLSERQAEDAAGADTTAEWLFADAEIRDSFSADARDRLTEIVKNGTIKLQRGFMCFPENDPLIENSKKVTPKEGFYDVAMHGSPTAVGFGTRKVNMSPRLLANIIRHRADYHGEKIRLLSCSTGLRVDNGYCFAEELANALGVIVEAPDMKIYTDVNGKTRVGWFGEGRMISYKPNERRRVK